MRLLDRSNGLINSKDWNGALAVLREADSLQKDRNAGFFFALLGTREAIVLSALGRSKEAEVAARMALAGWRGSPNARYWIGYALALVLWTLGVRHQSQMLAAV